MTVVNFTGNRKSSTPLDRKQMADWLRELAGEIESGEIIGLLYAALHVVPGQVDWDWYTLPPANVFVAIGALDCLRQEYTEHVRNSTVVKTEEDPS